MSFDLQRFSDAQAGVYEQALVELRAGRKQSHWMWFIFPQLRGLGRSETSRFYGLDGLAEARAYLADPVLGPRLRQSFEAVVAAPGTAEAILGAIDAMKLRSSATVFARASPDDSLFRVVLARFFDGRPDPATDALLGGSQADSQADT